MKRKATAIWNGTGKDGVGKLNSTSGVLTNTPYSFAMRFISEDGQAGTNPEELIAAAHAGCFNMALSFQLAGAGFTPVELNTYAVVNMENIEGHFEITSIELNLSAEIPEISKEQFLEISRSAKDNCPVSKALTAVPIRLNAQLI